MHDLATFQILLCLLQFRFPLMSHVLSMKQGKCQKKTKNILKLPDWLMIRQGIFNHDMITLNSGCGKLSNFALQLNVFGVTIQQPLMILHFYSPVFASLPMMTIIPGIFKSWLSVTISCQSLQREFRPSVIQIFTPIRDPRANWSGTFCFPNIWRTDILCSGFKLL